MDVRVRPHPKPTKARHYLKEWRQYRGLSQEKLAERVGKTHGAISQLERGVTDYTQESLEALAYALNCEPGDLLHVNPLLEREVIDITSLLRRADKPDLERALRVLREVLTKTTG